MNFQTILEELDRLYEAQKEVNVEDDGKDTQPDAKDSKDEAPYHTKSHAKTEGYPSVS